LADSPLFKRYIAACVEATLEVICLLRVLKVTPNFGERMKLFLLMVKSAILSSTLA
jgi:hypothetical protein